MKTILSLIAAASLAAPATAQSPAPAAPVQQAEACYRQGLAAEKAGDPIAAQKAYTAALAANPSHANARYSLGQLKLNSGAIATKGREAKLAAVVIPEYRLDGATLQEALDALAVLIEKQTTKEATPNFVMQDPNKQFADKKLTLSLKNTPAKAVLQYLMEMSSGKARYDEHAIVITPLPK